MNGDLVCRLFEVRISRSVDVVTGHHGQLGRCRVLRDQRCRLATGRVSQVVQQVAPNAVHPARGRPLGLLWLVLEDDGGNMDRARRVLG